MKNLMTWLLVVFLYSNAVGQPNGNGNGGNGNNGKGNGGCANPPCGGPNSVPINAEWLLFAGLLAGGYIKFSVGRKSKP